MSCIDCTAAAGGEIGVDSCGVCQGDGKSCLPTFDFIVSVPVGTLLGCSTAIAQATQSLVDAGKRPTTEQVQCEVMPANCTGESSYLTLCNSSLVQVIVKIRQDVWNGTTVDASAQLAVLNAAPSLFTNNLAATLGISRTLILVVALGISTTTLPPKSSDSTSVRTGQFTVSSSAIYSDAVLATLWVQNAGSVVTLSGQALVGVAITSQSVSLSGDLVLDISGLSVYDGMTFTLINATNITGQWAATSVYQTSECIEYQLDVSYSQQLAVGTLSAVSLCFASIESIVLGIVLV